MRKQLLICAILVLVSIAGIESIIYGKRKARVGDGNDLIELAGKVNSHSDITNNKIELLASATNAANSVSTTVNADVA